MAHSFKLEIQFYFSYSRSGWQMKIKIVRFTCEFLSGFQLDLLQHRAIKALTVCDVSHPVGYNFVHVWLYSSLYYVHYMLRCANIVNWFICSGKISAPWLADSGGGSDIRKYHSLYKYIGVLSVNEISLVKYYLNISKGSVNTIIWFILLSQNVIMYLIVLPCRCIIKLTFY